jgi:hypothetical protein
MAVAVAVPAVAGAAPMAITSLSANADPIVAAIDAHREAIATFQTAYKRLLALARSRPGSPASSPDACRPYGGVRCREGVDRHGADDGRRLAGAVGSSADALLLRLRLRARDSRPFGSGMMGGGIGAAERLIARRGLSLGWWQSDIDDE